MNIPNLAICLTPSIFVSKLTNSLQAITEQKYESSIFSDILLYKDYIFNTTETMKVIKTSISLIKQYQDYPINEEFKVVKYLNDDIISVIINDKLVDVPTSYLEPIEIITQFEKWDEKSNSKEINNRYLEFRKDMKIIIKGNTFKKQLEAVKETKENLIKLIQEIENKSKTRTLSKKEILELIEKTKRINSKIHI